MPLPISRSRTSSKCETESPIRDSFFARKLNWPWKLEAKFPGLFVPKYAMVTFHRVPYAMALNRGLAQDRMLSVLCDGIERVEDLDWSQAEHMIRSELTPLELPS
jgi:kynurenine 3-monooxygenase